MPASVMEGWGELGRKAERLVPIPGALEVRGLDVGVNRTRRSSSGSVGKAMQRGARRSKEDNVCEEQDLHPDREIGG